MSIYICRYLYFYIELADGDDRVERRQSSAEAAATPPEGRHKKGVLLI